MEHRYAERISGDLNVLIHKYNCPIAIGRIKNGSRSGIFIETDFVDIECEHQLTIEVVSGKAGNKKSQTIEMKAIVIHKTSKGFGAEVDIQQISEAEFFLEILRDTKTSQPSAPVFALVS